MILDGTRNPIVFFVSVFVIARFMALFVLIICFLFSVYL